MTTPFLAQSPSLDDYWRSIVLFGRNVASYKFALAKTLLEIRPEAGQLVRLDELAGPFSRHVAEHLRLAEKQATSASSKFLDSCRRFNEGEITQAELTAQTVRLGFNNVIDAFHVVGRDELPVRFYRDERDREKGIRITDQFSLLAETDQLGSLPREVEARWRLVETAWSLGIARNLLTIEYDRPTEGFLALTRGNSRISVTSSRDALNGYQKGRCFYCFRPISLMESALLPDVDHFFPHILKQYGFGSLVDGVWNLVLSCRECNRGADGKFERVPSIRLLERLSTRNEYLISSHHPLGGTLVQQTGRSTAGRRAHLQRWHSEALVRLIHQWEPKDGAPAVL